MRSSWSIGYIALLLVAAVLDRLNGQAQVISAFPSIVTIRGNAFGQVGSVDSLGISALGNAQVRFRLESITPLTGGGADDSAFLVMSPSTGTTPARVFVGPDPRRLLQLRPGRYSAGVRFSAVGQNPPFGGGATVILVVDAPPPPKVDRVVSAASPDSAAAIAPGALVYLEGENLAPPLLALGYDSGGLYPTLAGHTTVTFNGTPAPLLYLSPTRIAAVLPTSIAAPGPAEVVVSRYGAASPPVSVPVVSLAPELFASSPSGATQGAPLTFPAYAPLTEANPAAPGSVIILFATGFGPWPDTQDAAIHLGARSYAAQPVSLRIGGQPARLIYAGAAPYQTAGIVQINAFVPAGLAPGPQPVLLTVGAADNAGQEFTISIR